MRMPLGQDNDRSKSISKGYPSNLFICAKDLMFEANFRFVRQAGRAIKIVSFSDIAA